MAFLDFVGWFIQRAIWYAYWTCACFFLVVVVLLVTEALWRDAWDWLVERLLRIGFIVDYVAAYQRWKWLRATRTYHDWYERYGKNRRS
jgi:hypothetical protein